MIKADGTINASLKNDSGVCNTGGSAVLTNNAWHHVALVYNYAAAATIKVYVDGNEDASTATSAAWSFASQDIYVADSPDAYWEEFAGRIDDIQIYNNPLTLEEIQLLHSNPGKTKAPGDINTSGMVDEVDLALMAAYWLQTPGSPSADICPPPSGDGIVDILDLAVLANAWLD